MSDLLPVQRDLARLLFSLPEAAGYALAGGAALVVQQIVDRDTRDLDAFIAATPGPTPGTVDLLADAFTQAAQRAGWTLQTIRRHPTFCRFILDRDDDTVELDLAVDSPLLEPPTAIDGIPVLTPLDLAARKVLAIVDRLEARDYTDLHACTRSSRRATDLHRLGAHDGRRPQRQRHCGGLRTNRPHR